MTIDHLIGFIAKNDHRRRLIDADSKRNILLVFIAGVVDSLDRYFDIIRVVRFVDRDLAVPIGCQLVVGRICRLKRIKCAFLRQLFIRLNCVCDRFDTGICGISIHIVLDGNLKNNILVVVTVLIGRRRIDGDDRCRKIIDHAIGADVHGVARLIGDPCVNRKSLVCVYGDRVFRKRSILVCLFQIHQLQRIRCIRLVVEDLGNARCRIGASRSSRYTVSLKDAECQLLDQLVPSRLIQLDLRSRRGCIHSKCVPGVARRTDLIRAETRLVCIGYAPLVVCIDRKSDRRDMGIPIVLPFDHRGLGNGDSFPLGIHRGDHNAVHRSGFVKRGRSVDISDRCRSGGVVLPGISFGMERPIDRYAYQRLCYVDRQCGALCLGVAGTVDHFNINDHIVAVIISGAYLNIPAESALHRLAIFVGVKRFALGFTAVALNPILYGSNSGIVALILRRNGSGHVGVIIPIGIGRIRRDRDLRRVSIDHNMQRLCLGDGRNVMPGRNTVTLRLIIEADLADRGRCGNCRRTFIPSTTDQRIVDIIDRDAIFARAEGHNCILRKHIQVVLRSQRIIGIEGDIACVSGCDLLEGDLDALLLSDIFDYEERGGIIRCSDLHIHTIRLCGSDRITGIRNQRDLDRAVMVNQSGFNVDGAVCRLTGGNTVSVRCERDHDSIVLIRDQFFDIGILRAIVCACDRLIDHIVDLHFGNTVVVIGISRDLYCGILNDCHRTARRDRFSNNRTIAVMRNGDRVCLDKDRRDLYICSHRDLLAENGIVFNSLGSSVDRNGRDHVAFICRDDHGDHCILFHGNGHIAGAVQRDRAAFGSIRRNGKFLHNDRRNGNVSIRLDLRDVCLTLGHINTLTANGKRLDISTCSRGDLDRDYGSRFHGCRVLHRAVYLYDSITCNRDSNSGRIRCSGGQCHTVGSDHSRSNVYIVILPRFCFISILRGGSENRNTRFTGSFPQQRHHLVCSESGNTVFVRDSFHPEARAGIAVSG